MTSFNMLKHVRLLLVFSLMAMGSAALAGDADDLTSMLHEFLAGAGEAAAHERFWADDLIYTSSRGTRTNKAEIMRGFGDADDGDSEEAGPVYTAEDIQIQVYGTMAVVAFKLVATPPDDSDVLY
jgi:hypothetical protein